MSEAAASAAPRERVAHGRSALAGLLAGAVLAAALCAGFAARQQRALLEDRQAREMLASAIALAQLVAGAAAQDRLVQPLLEKWVEAEGQDAGARVVELARARLLASTFASDAALGALPRRLAREEKALYDEVQNLRVAVQTNVEEETVRKRQTLLERDGERLRVTVPYRSDGQIAGAVQLERSVQGRAPGVAIAGAAIAVLGPAAALLVALLAGLVRRRAAGTRAWGAFGLALALLAAAMFLYGRHEITRVSAFHTELAAELGASQAELAGRFSALGGAPIDPAAISGWDIDPYERPRGIIAGDGTVDPVALAVERARTVRALAIAFSGGVLLGAVLLAFFALGFARAVGDSIAEHREAYAYVMPAILGMLFLVFFPFSYGILLSFTDQTIYNVNEPITNVFVALSNYFSVLGDWKVATQVDGEWLVNYGNFYWTLFITVMWTVCNVAIGVCVGMLLALALNTPGLRGRTIYRVLLILPWAIPNYITALTWKGLFHPQLGQVNQAIQMFGGTPVAWFDGVLPSFITGIATNGWLSFPFMMVVILGALQSIPAEMYEAATLDGADRWQRFKMVTLPLIKPALVPAVIVSVVWTFNMFNVIYLVSGGQPAGANEILITKAYKIAFEQYRYGYAAAYSVVIFMILLVYGVFQARVTKAYEGV